ncbi:uncharacterized protein BROUX77_004442 [Berkeleyomyces rouxiae]|uniref:uncharacterized protein n=1 Tax=Berkeleyomyces rouxiae TaxID=2035830 RepID=UPI003B82325A
MAGPVPRWAPFGFNGSTSSRQQDAPIEEIEAAAPPSVPQPELLAPPPTHTPHIPRIVEPSPTLPPSRPLTYQELPPPPMSEVGRAPPPRTPATQDQDERERRRGRHHRKAKHEKRNAEGSPKKVLFCIPLPVIQAEEARKHILRCVASGILTVTVISIYLALILAGKFRQNEFSMLLVLLILSSTVIFCHSLVRAYVLTTRPVQHPTSDPLYNVQGYAIPREPIPVILARDEEAAGIESETTKLSPPAYGLWRSSVRVDPDGLHWQQNPNASSQEPEVARSGPRPPSYASEDGVSSVVDVVPGPTASSDNDRLPPHPSEVGRVDPSVL